MRNKPVKILLTALASLTMVVKAYAVCPVCTVVVVGGVIFAEKYGVDNTITGIWVGGLTVSLITWTINWLISKKDSSKTYKAIADFKYLDATISLAYFLMIPLPLFLEDYIGNPAKTLWGMDKLLLGMIIGAIAFYVAVLAYEQIKEKNNGKAHFPFEKVAFPVGSLIITSGIFYLITK